ncbi:uncharacterized protein LOC143632507 [Bidens hawaiensis]|uniref:uncharacterized protein LOC143632507 n=1 Tax=Bidens hawaiensis TaxID=980011 RepID=UPI00404A06DC
MSATATTNVFSLSKTIFNQPSTGVRSLRSQPAPLHIRPAVKAEFRRPLVGFRLACVGGGGGGGGGVNDGSGGGGGGDGGEVDVDTKVIGGDDVSSDVIILDVKGMSCGGCSGKVKRILESQPLVSAANVNLKTETAIVWLVPAAKLTPNWQKELGEKLAKHLTTCGFNSNIRGEAAIEEEAS